MTISLSIVTPSLNQFEYIDQTMRSVLEGTARPDEYVVVDGGSTDGTADVIAAHAGDLTWWVSEPDEGQYAALEKGLTRTTGEVMGWLNAGDIYMHWTLSVVRELFETFPHLEWLTTQRPMIADEQGRVVACEYVGGFSADSFRARVNLPGSAWFARAGIQQESTFWRRSLWDRAGGRLVTKYQYAGDFELWLRFFDHAQLITVDTPLAAHRVHKGQKTETLDRYVAEADNALGEAGFRRPGRLTSASRRAAYDLLGRRPLRRLPGSLARVLLSTALLHRTQTIVWRDGNWQEAADYAV
jgi:glycosyltransferase involved in cell wall biosynthesis